MSEPTAKIVKIDTSKIFPNQVDKHTENDIDWKGTSETSFLIEIAYKEQVYTRKVTFRVHDEKIHNIGGKLTKEDVENAIFAEVDQIQSLYDVSEMLQSEIDVDQIEKLKNQMKEV